MKIVDRFDSKYVEVEFQLTKSYSIGLSSVELIQRSIAVTLGGSSDSNSPTSVSRCNA
jgi:hypothetical protein